MKKSTKPKPAVEKPGAKKRAAGGEGKPGRMRGRKPGKGATATERPAEAAEPAYVATVETIGEQVPSDVATGAAGEPGAQQANPQPKAAVTDTGEPREAAPGAANPGTDQAKAKDSRLPPPGTVLQKRDRKGLLRCECVVEAEGVRYEGTLYRSLSAAALAAAKRLGLKAESANGFTFWGLSKPRNARSEADPLAGLSKRWEAYVLHLETALEKLAAGEHGTILLAAIDRQARILTNLHAEARESASASTAS